MIATNKKGEKNQKSTNNAMSNDGSGIEMMDWSKLYVNVKIKEVFLKSVYG